MKTTKPVCEKDPYKDGEIENHPAYGLVGIHRITGTKKLYGSALDNHAGFMTLTVYRSTRHHSLSRDWYSAKSVRPLLEIHMSSAQFAEFITTPNVGFGVPCTLHYVKGCDNCEGEVDRISSEATTEATKIVESFQVDLENTLAKLKSILHECESVLEKKALNKQDRGQVLKLLKCAVQEFGSNIPFVLSQFQEAADKTVAQSKAEIDAMFGTVINRLGLRELKKDPTLLLERNAGSSIEDNE